MEKSLSVCVAVAVCTCISATVRLTNLRAQDPPWWCAECEYLWFQSCKNQFCIVILDVMLTDHKKWNSNARKVQHLDSSRLQI